MRGTVLKVNIERRYLEVSYWKRKDRQLSLKMSGDYRKTRDESVLENDWR